MATGLRRIDNDTRTVRVLNYRYPYMVFEYSSGVLTYFASHYTHGVAGTDANWEVTKLSYTDGAITNIEVLDGAWDSRTSLDWA